MTMILQEKEAYKNMSNAMFDIGKMFFEVQARIFCATLQAP